MKFYKNYSLLIFQSKVNSRLHSSSSRLYISSSFLSFVIFLCLYFLWIKTLPPITYLGFKAFLPNLQSFQNCSRHVHYQVQSFCITHQDFSHLASILANTNKFIISDLCHQTNNISKVYLCHLTNTLANMIDLLKVDPYYLANIP